MPRKIKKNPGTYPVPQSVIDWYKARHKSKHAVQTPNWWPTPELTRDICNLVANGENILDALKRPQFPPTSTFFQWIAAGNKILQDPALKNRAHPDIPKLAVSWARARQARLEHDIEEMKIIEERLLTQSVRVMSPEGWEDNKGRRYPIINEAALDPQAARIVLESRRWRLSRELPERFGDRSKVEHSGAVKVERPSEHMPEWMKAQIETEAAKTATDSAPEPTPATAPAKPEKAKTIH